MKSKNTVEPEYYRHSYTVGQLLDYIEKHKIPREGKILIQRIEDRYFDGCDVSGMTGDLGNGVYGVLPEGSKANGWPTVKRPDYMHHMEVEQIAEIKAERDEFPQVTDQMLEDMQKSVDDKIYYNEYVAVQSPVGYDDFKHLYLDAHY